MPLRYPTIIEKEFRQTFFFDWFLTQVEFYFFFSHSSPTRSCSDEEWRIWANEGEKLKDLRIIFREHEKWNAFRSRLSYGLLNSPISPSSLAVIPARRKRERIAEKWILSMEINSTNLRFYPRPYQTLNNILSLLIPSDFTLTLLAFLPACVPTFQWILVQYEHIRTMDFDPPSSSLLTACLQINKHKRARIESNGRSREK